MIAKIAPCIFISGNHDISLGNTTHNSLKSVLEQQLNTENKTFLLLEQKLYKYNNIIFGHTKFGMSQQAGLKILENFGGLK
jgi:3',5'-cyclic AMP phosphodiesterase CpdA